MDGTRFISSKMESGMKLQIDIHHPQENKCMLLNHIDGMILWSLKFIYCLVRKWQ